MELLGSAVVAALISGVVAVLVARRTAEATIRSAEIHADVERHKAELEIERIRTQDRTRERESAAEAKALAADHLTEASRCWGIAQGGGDAGYVAHWASDARKSLVKALAAAGPQVQSDEIPPLLEALAKITTQQLQDMREAEERWPKVEAAILAWIQT